MLTVFELGLCGKCEGKGCDYCKNGQICLWCGDDSDKIGDICSCCVHGVPPNMKCQDCND